MSPLLHLIVEDIKVTMATKRDLAVTQVHMHCIMQQLVDTWQNMKPLRSVLGSIH